MGDASSAGWTDAVLRSLRRPYRRRVLTFFADSDAETAHVDALAEYVGNGNDEPHDRERVARALDPDAFPAPAETGIADDDEAHVVRFHGNAPATRALALLPDIGEAPW